MGNQAENVFGGEGFKTLPVHGMADRHIAGKAQQPFVHILRTQFRPHYAGRKDGKAIFPLSHKEAAFLHLLFYVLLQLIADLFPAHQPPHGVADGNRILAGKFLQRQPGKMPLQQLIGEKSFR